MYIKIRYILKYISFTMYNVYTIFELIEVLFSPNFLSFYCLIAWWPATTGDQSEHRKIGNKRTSISSIFYMVAEMYFSSFYFINIAINALVGYVTKLSNKLLSAV